MIYIDVIFKTILFLWLLVCTIQDIMKQEISLIIILIGFILLFTISIIQGKLLIWDRIGGLALGVILILLNKITRGQIGLGDGLVLSITGISLGFYINSLLLTYGLLCAAIFSVIYMFVKKISRKKISRKKTIPFIPFIFIVLLGVLLDGKSL